MPREIGAVIPSLMRLFHMGIRVGSMAASVYLLWNGRWRVIVTAIAFSLLTPAITALVDLPMGVFWKELGYPEALNAPGLQFLVNPVRLLMVSRIPHLMYGGLAYCIGLAAFLLFGSSSHAMERAALMIIGCHAGFALPIMLGNGLALLGKPRGGGLNHQLLCGKMAFFTLLLVHSVTPLALWPAAALLAVAMLGLECGFEVALWRRLQRILIRRLATGAGPW